MARAPRGTRQLLVDGVQYRWCVVPNDELGLGVVIERAELRAQRLMCWLEHGVVVSPALVRRAILDALVEGWVPTQRGAEFVQRVTAHAEGESALQQCPVCDYFTLPRRAAYEVCPVCFWEHGELELDGADPNHLLLCEARANFREFGACSLEMRGSVLSEQARQRYRCAPR